VSKAIGRPLDWQHDDLALQNIQARTRSPGIWLLANLRGALLLSTSNRSEAAVGYATMDGDTSGGLSPIAGIDKAYLRRWLVWLEKQGPVGSHAIPALAAVNVQAPTAELRPAGAGQTDEQDLMPYELLDAIERAAIGEKHTPLETYLQMRSQFPQYGSAQLGAWIERFFRLWCRNQWKRERYAPSFHLDDQNLDPKTWCRFPILSGGFERELADLQAYLQRSAKKSD
jgi:NAD+ synthase (glutamine-hydrolysing)